MSVRTYENRESKRRNSDVKMRIEALHEALDAGRSWLSTQTIAQSEKQLSIARGRLRQSLDHTVVALAGPTGAGKSSLLNALADQDLAKVSVRRPTTSQGLSVVWDPSQQGRTDAARLLEWLGVPDRQYLAQDTETGPRKKKHGLLTGLVLVDLPDFDSVVAEHRVRADNLTERSDLLVWVTDPQKYADAIFHHEYLQRFSNHTDMLVVLNQVDRLTLPEKEQCLADIRRLLTKSGITGATVLAVSTRTGEGVTELRSLLEIAVTRRAAQAQALVAELQDCGRKIAEECGKVPSRTESEVPKERLVEAFAQASGVSRIAEAVYDSSVRRSHIATGWPVTSWISRMKRDPLRALGLAQKWIRQPQSGPAANGPSSEIFPKTARSSMTVSDEALAAKSRLAVREYIDAATDGGPTPWVLEVRREMSDVDVSDELDSAITNSPAIRLSSPKWWTFVSYLHKLFLAIFVAGAVWLGVLALSSYLRLEVPNTPSWMGYPIPTLMTLGGLLLGIALGLLCRIFAIVHARRQSRRVYGALRADLEEVAFRRVVQPVRQARDQREACVLAALVAAR